VNPECWKSVGELFERAVALPPGERTVCVERGSAGDDELRKEVLSLLASHKALSGGFVQEQIRNSVVAFYQATLAHPTSIGPYRVIRELGRGGMGVVFLGERDDIDGKAKVAIKLVCPGMDSEFILSRFRRERQTLARMKHPNIAQLIDSGTTSQGLPYIVMEYIDGPRLTDHARELKLETDARLILFLSICSAVDYAHRNFVIHRDIKPGNILVDPEGVPKLLDFGICKLLAESVSDLNPNDTASRVLMTPSYASPEQVRGEGVNLLSDVYSLGVVLYELLTDKSFAKLDSHAHGRPVAHSTDPRASMAVDDRALKRRLSGDLDTILMRALETEPHRRYESAALFADDLRHHLLQQPILARPQTFAYRAAKFLRRNRVKSMATTTALLMVLAGFLTAFLRGTGKTQLIQLTTGNGGNSSSPKPDALRSLRDSTTEVREVIASYPQSAPLSTQLYRAVASQELGDRLNRDGNFAEAKKAYADSVSIAESNLKSGQDSFLTVFIGSSRKLGLNAIAQGNRDEALGFARHALELSSRVSTETSQLAPARGLSAMAVIYAELLRSPLRQPDDREQAISWLRKSAEAWRQAESHTHLGALQQYEMRETEQALTYLENK